MGSVKKALSKFRKRYYYHFAFRCLTFIMTVILCIFKSNQFSVMDSFNFFKKITVFHFLWVLYMVDMVMTLVPCRKHIPLGSQKFLLKHFRPLEFFQPQNLINYVKKCNKDTLIIGAVWFALTSTFGILYFTGLISKSILMVISMFFHVCDLICVLFWCPFRVWFMKNRCCTTCRIFNWDHMMRFSPLVFVPGFFTWSLCAMSLVVLFVWEISFALHPERFWEGSNDALKCSNCTDRLCGERNCVADKFSLKGGL